MQRHDRSGLRTYQVSASSGGRDWRPSRTNQAAHADWHLFVDLWLAHSTMRNGFAHFTLFAGYAGSLTFGSAMTVFAFDEKCSKILYLVHAPLWLLVFWFTVGLLPKLQIVAVVGGSVAMWFVLEGRVLRFHNLFLGLMSLFYPLWDAMDDYIHNKQNESDVSLMARLIPSITAGSWAFLFILLSNGLLALMIVLGLHFFPGDIHAAAVNFLPTTHIGDPEARFEDAIKQYR